MESEDYEFYKNLLFLAENQVWQKLIVIKEDFQLSV